MSHSSAGVEAIWWGLENSSGDFTGDALTIAAGENDEMALADGIQEFTLAIPETNLVNVNFNDAPGFTFQFKPDSNASGQMNLGIMDFSLATAPVGGNTFTHEGTTAIALLTDGLAFRNVWLTVNSQAKSADLASFGNAGYEVTTVRATLFPRGRNGWSYQTEAQYQYDIVAVPFTSTIMGETLTSAKHGATKIYGGIKQFFTNKQRYGAFEANSSATTFDLDGVPAVNPSDATLYDIVVYTSASGTLTAVTQVASSPSDATEFEVTETGGVYTVEFGAAPTTGNVFYRYGYV